MVLVENVWVTGWYLCYYSATICKRLLKTETVCLVVKIMYAFVMARNIDYMEWCGFAVETMFIFNKKFIDN